MSGGVATRHPRRQHRVGVGARATGDDGVDDLDAGVLLREHVLDRLEAVRLAARGPVGEDLHLRRCPGDCAATPDPTASAPAMMAVVATAIVPRTSGRPPGVRYPWTIVCLLWQYR